MSRYLFFLISIIALLGIISCQKEFSSETTQGKSKGSLQSDVTSECLPKTIAGTYVAGKGMNDSNYIEVNINVTNKGAYSISTDTINGYSFSGKGVFNDSGINKVRLAGFGVPALSGNNLFVISYDSTFCLVQIVVLPAGSSGQSSFTLQGSGGNCLNSTVGGNYVKAVALNSSNTVTLSVNVTSLGAYSITTAPVNGMTFTGAGSFSNTGIQNITLTGAGTPSLEGSYPVTVTSGSSTCAFTVVVTATAPPPLPGDYFPLTANSWWSYDDPGKLYVSTNDSLTRLNINAITYQGVSYRIFQEQEGTTPFDSSYYRRSGNDYLELTFADLYTAVFTFDTDVIDTLNFLKENLTNGQTWQSKEFTGKTGGVDSKLKYLFTCTNANATVTINGKSFNNVYQVNWKPQYSTGGAAYQDDPVNFTSYYAKGIGLIYLKAIAGSQTFELKIRNWKVF